MKRTCALLLLALAAPAVAQEGETVTITVEANTPLQGLLDRMGSDTGKSILYDPRNQRIHNQTVGAAFRHEVPRARLLDAYRSILAFYELTLVPIGPQGYEVYLVVDSRSTNHYVRNKAAYVAHQDLEKYADRDGFYIACAIPVRHIENLTTLRTALSTMVSPAGIGRVHEVPGARSLLVMDFAPNVAGMARLVARMDVEERKIVTATIELEFANAALLAATLEAAVNEPAADAPPGRRGPPAPEAPRARIVPYEPRNALVVAATAEELERIRALVASLDRPPKHWVAVGGG